jgi:hypothetical protein
MNLIRTGLFAAKPGHLQFESRHCSLAMFAYGLTRLDHGASCLWSCGCAAEAKSHAVSGFLSPLLQETVQGGGFPCCS